MIDLIITSAPWTVREITRSKFVIKTKLSLRFYEIYFSPLSPGISSLGAGNFARDFPYLVGKHTVRKNPGRSNIARTGANQWQNKYCGQC